LFFTGSKTANHENPCLKASALLKVSSKSFESFLVEEQEIKTSKIEIIKKYAGD
jgi:hypothetical protein